MSLQDIPHILFQTFCIHIKMLGKPIGKTNTEGSKHPTTTSLHPHILTIFQATHTGTSFQSIIDIQELKFTYTLFHQQH